MQRLSTTVLALVGDQAEQVVVAPGEGMNVRVLEAQADPVATWARVRRTRSPYCVILDDPLEEVAQAWQELFATRRATGALEVAVTRARARIRSGALDLPDYYIAAGDSAFHLAALAPQAVHRVVPIDRDLRHTVAGLRAGRWWPSADRLLDALDHRLPDRLTAPAERPTHDGAARLLTG